MLVDTLSWVFSLLNTSSEEVIRFVNMIHGYPFYGDFVILERYMLVFHNTIKRVLHSRGVLKKLRVH